MHFLALELKVNNFRSRVTILKLTSGHWELQLLS